MNDLEQQLIEVLGRAKQSVVQVRNGQRGIGTGVIWRTGPQFAEIITNHHVVAGEASALRVVLHNDHDYAAQVTRRSPELDLAMLRIATQGEAMTAASVADSAKLRIGEWVFAIGNPWGARDVVTHGIVSGFGKVGIRGTDRVAEYVRSDVALAPGNSGGPLLNIRGEVIGINAMIMGGDLSVAIPSHVASEWIAGQPDNPVRLGIVIQPVPVPAHTPSNWTQGRQNRQGLLVVDVDVAGPAAQSVFVGDVVLGIAGQAVDSADALISQVAQLARQKSGVRLNILRGNTLREIDVSL